MTNDIDIVLPWVDGNDPLWRAERKQYRVDHDVDEIRYESWDCLHYVFRGIEKFLPEIRYIFFVTWGHLPPWLNTLNPKLKIVKHDDYIPHNYLPTFNSNTIEMNYWRIDELSENFILFNDDFYPIGEFPDHYFFKDDLPCGESIETHFVLKEIGDADIQIAYAQVNNMVILNDHFNKGEVIEKFRDKWFHPDLGERISHNEAMRYWHNFESFVFPHEAMPMKKSVLSHLWEIEYAKLDRGSKNKFRSSTDITHRLVSQWQFCTGQYIPRKSLGHVYHANNANMDEIISEIKQRKYPIVCVNEDSGQDFAMMKNKLQKALGEVLPEKSSYEK